jgi:hypothetical protein
LARLAALKKTWNSFPPLKVDVLPDVVGRMSQGVVVLAHPGPWRHTGWTRYIPSESR